MRSEIWSGVDFWWTVFCAHWLDFDNGVLESWTFVLFDFFIFRRSTWILRQPELIQTAIFKSTVLRDHAVDFKKIRCFRKLKVRTFWWSYFWEDPRGFWDPTWRIPPYTPQAVWFHCCIMSNHLEIGSKSTWMFEKWKVRTFMIPKHESLLKTTRNCWELPFRFGSSIPVSYCMPL